MGELKCVYPGCEEDAEFLPVAALPLCKNHYALHRFIMEHLHLSKWKHKWENFAVGREE